MINLNHFIYSNQNKRYYTVDYFYKQKFHCKISKISLDAGFSCPNIDGTVGYSGCIYCSKKGSGDFAGNKEDSLEKQFYDIKEKMDRKWKNAKYIAYFQAHTNTYAPVKILKEKYECVLKIKDVVGISIATRCDAISEECLDYLTELNKKTFLTVELGLQTIHESTSKLINRCHTLECFDHMVKKLHERNIKVTAHIINGLPYETEEMMIKTIEHLNTLPIWGIKIHMLHILKNTALEKFYQQKKFPILTFDDYIRIVVHQIEHLRKDIVIHRITGDPDPKELIEPTWLLKKFNILNAIDKALKKRDTYQGFCSSILNYVRRSMDYYIKPKDIVIDATVGNGKDTLYLCKKASEGKVFGFDIQKQAIDQTEKRLQGYHNYQLFCCSHLYMKETLKDYIGKISLIVFNLGYLPKGKKEITTKVSSTLQALKDSLDLLNAKGALLITVYPGHEEGAKESKAIKEWITTLRNHQVKEFHNTENPEAPYFIEITK